MCFSLPANIFLSLPLQETPASTTSSRVSAGAAAISLPIEEKRPVTLQETPAVVHSRLLTPSLLGVGPQPAIPGAVLAAEVDGGELAEVVPVAEVDPKQPAPVVEAPSMAAGDAPLAVSEEAAPVAAVGGEQPPTLESTLGVVYKSRVGRTIKPPERVWGKEGWSTGLSWPFDVIPDHGDSGWSTLGTHASTQATRGRGSAFLYLYVPSLAISPPYSPER